MKMPPMYRSLTPLDRIAHKNLKMRTDMVTISQARGINSVFLNVVEFNDAMREFPIVFVRTGEGPDGQAGAVAPLAVMGLKNGENLFLDADARFNGDYAPAYLRRYPFAMARMEGSQDGQLAVCIDDQWDGFTPDGQPLFNDKGETTELTQNLVKFLETYEAEMERTRQACALLDEVGVLEAMRFEAEAADGSKVEVEGFLAVNTEKLSALSDAKLAEFQRNGLLSILEIHRLSLANMGRLAAKRTPV
jgi:primosomal replication protein N